MKCFRCGAENLEKSRFCCMCGVKLEEDGDKDTVPLEKLADSGDANAQCELGAVYFRGEGVPKDYQKAAEWFQQSAENGNVVAMAAKSCGAE